MPQVKWTREQIEAVLQENEWQFETKPLPNGALQFVLTDGTPISWWPTTGNVLVQGKATEVQEKAKEIFGKEPPIPAAASVAVQSPQEPVRSAPPNRVFIVYGHDVLAREQLELILRRLRLEPIVLQNIPGGGDTLIEKLEELTDADFACVLLTPDDEGHIAGKSNEIKPRARQNVVFGFGMVLARLGRSRVAILVKGSELEKPSDMQGLIYIPFSDRVDEAKNLLAANLQNAGFDIQVADLL